MDYDNQQDVIEQLASARERAMTELAKLLPELKNIDPEQKFLISMNALRTGNRTDLVEQTLETALTIQDQEVRANSLLDFLNEINYLIDSKKPQ